MRELDMLIRHGNIAVAKSASDLSHHENRVADIFKQMRANTKIEAAPSNINPTAKGHECRPESRPHHRWETSRRTARTSEPLPSCPSAAVGSRERFRPSL